MSPRVRFVPDGIEAEVLGDARRNRVEHRCRMYAAGTAQDGAETFTSFDPLHVVCCLFLKLRWRAQRALLR